MRPKAQERPLPGHREQPPGVPGVAVVPGVLRPWQGRQAALSTQEDTRAGGRVQPGGQQEEARVRKTEDGWQVQVQRPAP